MAVRGGKGKIMAAMVPDAMSGVRAARDAGLVRAEALVAVRAKAERGDFTHALSDLLRDALGSRPLLRLHIWRVEQAAFDNRTATCKRHARIAAEWCGVDGARAGSLTLAWLLDERTGGARLAAWLLAISLDMRDAHGGRAFLLSGPDPFAHVRS